MFIRKSAENIKYILDYYLPKELVENPNIIIAGGFALNAYMSSQILSSLSGPEKSLIEESLLQKPIIHFTDIDLWKKANSQSLNIQKNEDINFVCELSGFRLSCQKTSYWAVSYNSSKVGGCLQSKIQFIRKEVSSEEELISGFDLGLSSIAISNGEFIIHKSFFDSLESKQISFNKKPKIYSLGNRIFQSLRYFKYNRKLGFDFSPEVHKYIFDTILDCNILWEEGLASNKISAHGNIKKNDALLKAQALIDGLSNWPLHKTSCEEKFVKIKITSCSNYEQEVITKETLIHMIRQLDQDMKALCKMKNFDKSRILFLVGSKVFDIKNLSIM
jgi:hypothetical protein